MHSVVIDYRPNAYPALEAAMVSAFNQAGEEGVRVVLSLDGLESLDTDGIRGLISLLRRSRSLGGDLALRASKPVVRRTLEVTALDRIFPMADQEAA